MLQMCTPQMKGGNFRIDKDVVFFATPPFESQQNLLVLVHSQRLVVEYLIEKMSTRNFVFGYIA